MCGFSASNIYNFKSEFCFFEAIEIRGRDGVSSGKILNFNYHFSRLALNDLSTDGLQPIYSHCRKYAILFNGELYNFKALKRQLVSMGIKFLTNTDTEVFINLISVWGLDKAISEAQGAFSVAIFDLNNSIIYLFRDGFGEKPLFYSHSSEGFSFSSCLTSFATLKKISKKNATEFCENGYLTRNKTIFENVFSVSNHEILEYNIENQQLTSRSFQNLFSSKPVSYELEEAINSSVSIMSNADAKVGIFLSGGVDSSLIASACAEMDLNLKCYSFNTKFYGQNETDPAKNIAKHFGFEHAILDLEDVELKDHMDEYIASMTEPNTDPSYFALFELAKLAGKDVKAVLTGDGADELFMGYKRHSLAMALEQSRVLQILLFYLSFAIRCIHTKKFTRTTNIFDQIYSLLSGQYEDYILKRISRRGKFKKLNLTELLTVERNTFLLNQVLRKSDMAGIANGVEVRAPFLMKPVVSASSKYKPKELNNILLNKRPLRKLLKLKKVNGLITKGKKGFQLDLQKLLEEELYVWAKTVLSKETLEGIVDQKIAGYDIKKKWNYIILSAWLDAMRG